MKKMIAIATSAAMLASLTVGPGQIMANEVQNAKSVKNVLASKVDESGKAVVVPFDLHGKAGLAAYNEVFKISRNHITSITNNGGNYSSSAIGKAIDGDMATHWETGKPNTSAFTNEVVVQFNELTTLNRIVYSARQDGAKGKGFAREFDIYASTSDEGNEFTLVTSGEYKGWTGDVVEIKFAPTAFKRVKFVFKKADQDWASASEFGFYKEDKVRDVVNSLFTDGTMSAVVPDYNSAAKLTALENEAKLHPLYSELKERLELAKKLVSGQTQIEGTIITAEQRGDMRKHASQNLRFTLGTNNQPTGFVAMPGQEINVYVDVESADKLPSIVFSQQEAAWNVWASGKQLRPGKNTFIVPEFASNSYYAHPVTKGGTVYISNPYTAEEQGKAPRIRIEGGQKIPFMTKDTDPQEFKSFLTEYKQMLDADKAAHPDVKDRKLIDVVEMASEHIIFTGTASEAYKKFITQGEDPVGTLTGYDYWMKKNFEFYGLDGRDTNHDPKRIRENIRLMQPYGAMYAAGDHTGIQAGTVSQMLSDFTKVYPGWGLTHEIGHRMAVGEREYGEITNNMLAMLMSVDYQSIDTRIPYQDIYKYVIEENKVAMEQQSLFARLGAFWQLELAHPGYWKELNSLYRDRKVSLPNGENSKQQYLVEFSSEVLGKDLSSYFARHGFTVNADTREKVSVYPAPKKLWYLNNSVINYKGNGFVEQAPKITASVIPNVSAKTNTLSISLDKSYAEDLLGYEIYRDNKLVGFTSEDQFVDQNIDTNVNYTYKIVAYDKTLKTLKPVEFKAFKPALSAQAYVTLKLNQSFNPMDYVKASTYQGNDISSEVVVKSNNVDVTRKGNYQVVYEVKSGGVVESRTSQVTVTSDYVFTSDLNAASATVGWSELKKDRAPGGGMITLLRQGMDAVYAKGLGVHANSEVIYHIEGKGYDFFESYIGIDQSMKGRPSSATFEVYVDGEKKFDSSVFRASTEQEFVRIPVTGAKEIKLVTTDANDSGNSADHTVWADAKFTNNSSVPTLTLPDETTFVALNGEFDVLKDVQAFDNEDGDLIGKVEVKSNGFTTGKTGTYQVELSVSDSDGNTVTKTRNIVVYSASKYMSDVEWVSARTDYNVVRKDKSSTNATIKLLVQGKVQEFAKGIGTHANSEIVYNLANSNYEYFETYVGVDRNIPEQNNSSVIFKLVADGQEVYNSGLMKFSTEAKLVRIPVKGVQELKLIVDNAGNGNASDHGSFGDAKFIILNDKPELTIPKSVSTKVGEVIPLKEHYAAIDAEDGDLTAQVTVTGESEVNFNRAGEYPITYSVTDSDGNTVTKERTVAVVDMNDYHFLTDYDWSSTQNSYAAPVKDKSISAKALRLTDENNREVIYERGIGAHSNSTIVYDLTNKNMDYFTSFVGVDRQMYGSIGSVSFEVYVDGELKFNSGVMQSRDPQKFIEVDINGAKELKLVVTDGGNGNGSDHATWGDAKFHFANADHIYVQDLQQAVVEAQAINVEDYTPESVAVLTNSLAKAEEILANPAANQSEIDTAVASIRAAMASLVKIDLTQVVAIPDQYLRDGLKKTLGITGDITLADMHNLISFKDETRRVSSLKGLEYAKNLVTLDITGAEVTDFSPLKDLKKLANLMADPQLVEVGGVSQGPIIEVDNLVTGRDGKKIIPVSAGIRHNKTFKETVLDVSQLSADPNKFIFDLSNEDKGYYTMFMAYQVDGNLVQLIYMIDNK
ncbi:NPCBM/NEW2 domain-containing protein [Paenibacillus sp. EC2-1]|uniref:NPCBM/NEW2 domain-containing protein n=1 Tax=Paenibacillus sp. EC2-1 TaxID=3388665 RepID=UPI003BEEF02A